jgi:hypothetical protein
MCQQRASSGQRFGQANLAALRGLKANEGRQALKCPSKQATHSDAVEAPLLAAAEREVPIS